MATARSVPPQNADSGYNYTASVALGDLNGDGWLDLATANQSGSTLSVLLNQLQPETLELIAPDGVTVLASADATDNVQAAFSNFIATDTGTYYLRVSGPPTVRAYTIVATRDADFDLGDNDTTATAQPMGPVHVALGDVGGSGDPSDVYSFAATAGQVIHLYTTTPGDGPGGFGNTLDPHLRVVDASGTTVAEGVPSADGRNEDITFTASDSATYYVEVSAEAGTSGEYVLDPRPLDVALALAERRPAIGSASSPRSESAGLAITAAAAIVVGRNPARPVDFRIRARSFPGRLELGRHRVRATRREYSEGRPSCSRGEERLALSGSRRVSQSSEIPPQGRRGLGLDRPGSPPPPVSPAVARRLVACSARSRGAETGPVNLSIRSPWTL